MTPTLFVGPIAVTVLADGADAVPPDMILAGVPAGHLDAIVAGHLDAAGQLPVACNGLLIRSAGRNVLVDAGYGDWAESPTSGGGMARSLAATGVTPDDIHEVIVTHGHADHIGGLTRVERGARRPVYRAASHWFARREWTYWTAEETLSGLPEDLANPARASLPPLADAGLVRLVDEEQEVAPGVVLVPAPGHTPGHASVSIASGVHRALFVGDAVFHPLNVAHPEWGCIFDVDRAAAARSRLRLLEQAAAEEAVVLGAHLPAAGRVERTPGGYRFVPVSSPADTAVDDGL